MHNNITKKLLNLEEFSIEKIEDLPKDLQIHINKPVSNCSCPKCCSTSIKIHDYRIQKIKDAPIRDKAVTIFYKKRRYLCKSCSKKFYESNNIVARYHRLSKRLVAYVVEKLSSMRSAKSISDSANISPNLISRLLPCLSIPRKPLPRVLCIDEFRGNSGHFKYQVLLLDGETHEIIDVLECRYKHFLCDYFKHIPESERNNVKYVVGDLWETYSDIAFTYFRKAKYVADHFHFVRYAVQAVDKVRKRVQKNLPKKERKHFKHSRHLLLSNHNKLNNQNCEELLFILTNYSEDLRLAYKQKELFINLISSDESYEEKLKALKEWIWNNLNSNIHELVECVKTFQHWFQPIRNSLAVPFSNGPIEGKNNKIKVLKRITYGMKKFINFKARILLACS